MRDLLIGGAPPDGRSLRASPRPLGRGFWRVCVFVGHQTLTLALSRRPPPTFHPPQAEAQERQRQYAAELQAQVAARERQRQSERAHGLRQSVSLLQLRQNAPSAVLPAALPGWLPTSRGHQRVEDRAVPQKQWQEEGPPAADGDWTSGRQHAEQQRHGLEHPWLDAHHQGNPQQPQLGRSSSSGRSSMVPPLYAPQALPPLHAAARNGDGAFAAVTASPRASSRAAAEQRKRAYQAELAAQMAYKQELQRKVGSSKF